MLLVDILLTSASYPEFEAKVSLYSSYFETTHTHTHTHFKMNMLYLIKKKMWQQITSNIIN